MKTNCLKNSRHFSFSQLHIENTSNANIYIYSTFNNLKLYSLEHAFIQSNNCSNQIQIFNFQQETIQSNPIQRIISQTLFIIYIYTHTHLKNKHQITIHFIPLVTKIVSPRHIIILSHSQKRKRWQREWRIPQDHFSGR